MDYSTIFKPETLSKLNKQSADNLRRVKQEFNLMDQMAYLRLLQDITRIEAPHKEQLEQLALNMIHELYPVIQEQGIKIDAKLTDMAGTRAELDEIKVNNPNNEPILNKYYNIDNSGETFYHVKYIGREGEDYIFKNENITIQLPPKYKDNIRLCLIQTDNIDESISPEGRRRVINAITQGSALKGAFSFYLFKDHLDEIDPTLVEKYNEVMKRTFGVYDDDNIIAMMMAMLAQGVDLKGQAGGSSKVIINEIKVNNPLLIFPIQVNNDNELDKEVEKLKKQGFNIDKGGHEGHYPIYIYGDDNFGGYVAYEKLPSYRVIPKYKSRLGESIINEQKDSNITIRARAINFPMLVHEIIKGLYELISLQGFKGTKQQNQDVVNKVDKLEHEPMDLRFGQHIFDALNDIYIEYGGDDSRVREYFFQEIYQLEDEDFIEYIENAINGTLTPQEKSWTKQVIKEIILDLKSDDFEASGLQESILNKGLLAGLLLSAGLTYGQLKPEYKAKIDSIQKVTTLSPQQKRAEIQKIVQLNRDEISGKKREEFLRTMKAAGFTDEEEYKKYLAKNAKKKDVGLDGLEIGKANKRGEDKGSCSTGQTNKGESLKDTK